jgi:hypothetical protein
VTPPPSRKGSRKPIDDAGDVQPCGLGHDRGGHDREERERHRGPPPRAQQHDPGDHERHRDRHRTRVAREVRDRVPRRLPHPLPLAGHAECRGRLLERDDDGDARRETLDDGGGHIAGVPADPGQREHHEHDPREQADREHPARAVTVHDRDEDDGHGPRGPRHLEVAAAEDGGDRARDDGGRQAGLRAQPGADPEGQRERQGHHRDREPGDQVAARAAAGRSPVGGRGQQPRDPAVQPPGRAGHSAASA